MADPKWDDTEPVEFEDTMAIDEEPKFEETAELEPSQVEAGLAGAFKGASFGLLDELKGALEAGGSTVGLRGLGGEFKDIRLETDEEDKQGLLDIYRQARDAERERQKKLEEAHPGTTLAGEIAGGLATAPLMMGKAAQGLGTASKIGKAAVEGAKAGAAYGAGMSEADLTKGDVGQFAKDVAGSGFYGGAFSAAIPAAGAAIKGVGERIPGFSALKAGFKYGAEEGKALSKENISEDIKKLSNKIYNGIRTRLKKYGVAKEEALDLADEIGIRVDAGQPIEDALDETLGKKAYGPEAAEVRDKWVQILNELKGEQSRDLAKVVDAVEKHRVKTMITKPTADIGDIDTFIQDGRAGAKYDITKLDPKTGRIVDIPSGVKVGDRVLDQRDITNLSLRELQNLIDDFRASMGKTKDLTPEARKLQAQLYKLREEASKKLGRKTVATKYKKMSDLLTAAEEFGIDKMKSGRSDIDASRKVDEIRKLIGQTSDSAQFKKERAYKMLKGADRKFGKDIESRGRQLEELKDIVGMEDIRTISPKGLLGSLSAAAGKAGNVAGEGVYAAKKVGKALQDAVNKGYAALRKATPETLEGLATQLEQKGGGAVAYANQLRKAATQDGRARQAILHGLYQQPAFRETVKEFNPFFEGEE